jgi:hypothetical protein
VAIVRAAIRVFTVLVLVLSLGLHWALLQTLAWTGMIITYSRDASLREAISMTFDGEHPCSLCKVIKQGRSEEKQPEQQQVRPGSKLDCALIWQTPFFCFDVERELISPFDSTFSTRAEAPPKPRPKAFSLTGFA